MCHAASLFKSVGVEKLELEVEGKASKNAWSDHAQSPVRLEGASFLSTSYYSPGDEYARATQPPSSQLPCLVTDPLSGVICNPGKTYGFVGLFLVKPLSSPLRAQALRKPFWHCLRLGTSRILEAMGPDNLKSKPCFSTHVDATLSIAAAKVSPLKDLATKLSSFGCIDLCKRIYYPPHDRPDVGGMQPLHCAGSGECTDALGGPGCGCVYPPALEHYHSDNCVADLKAAPS
ncbi:hypothetical protein B0H19DRAFT_1380059, partial [Mycena capillaripes]